MPKITLYYDYHDKCLPIKHFINNLYVLQLVRILYGLARIGQIRLSFKILTRKPEQHSCQNENAFFDFSKFCYSNGQNWKSIEHTLRRFRVFIKHYSVKMKNHCETFCLEIDQKFWKCLKTNRWRWKHVTVAKTRLYSFVESNIEYLTPYLFTRSVIGASKLIKYKSSTTWMSNIFTLSLSLLNRISLPNIHHFLERYVCRMKIQYKTTFIQAIWHGKL